MRESVLEGVRHDLWHNVAVPAWSRNVPSLLALLAVLANVLLSCVCKSCCHCGVETDRLGRETPGAQPRGTEIYSLTPECSVLFPMSSYTLLKHLTHTPTWLQFHLQSSVSELRMTDTNVPGCTLSCKRNVFVCSEPVSIFGHGHWNLRIFFCEVTAWMWTWVQSGCKFLKPSPRHENAFLVGLQHVLYFICLCPSWTGLSLCFCPKSVTSSQPCTESGMFLLIGAVLITQLDCVFCVWGVFVLFSWSSIQKSLECSTVSLKHERLDVPAR